MRVASPAIASSTELSTTSYTRWCRPDGPVDPMYMPGRSRTGSRPFSTVMSLAVYATRDAFRVWVGGTRAVPRRGGWNPVKALVRTPKCLVSVYQTTCAGPFNPHPNFAHDIRADQSGGALDEVGREIAQLGAARRGVDGHAEYSVAKRTQLAVRTQVAAHEVLPLGNEGGERVRLGETEVRAHLRQRVAQGARSFRFSAAPRHAASSTRPSRTRNRRSGSIAPGTADAVVIRVWPAGSSATSASPRAGSSSLKTSSRSNTGSVPTTSAHTRWPASRSPSAIVRCSPCDAWVRASRPARRSRHSSRWGPTRVTPRSSSAACRATSAALNSSSTSLVAGVT